MKIDVEKNMAYYAALPEDELCGCGYCLNLRRQVREAYPELAAYLAALGIDIAKPFETSPLEMGDYVEYLSCDYVVLGKAPVDFKQKIGGVTIGIADIHPSTGVAEEHFVLELGSLELPWRE